MLFEIACPCGKTLGVTGTQAGSNVTCPCGKEVPVPSLSELRRNSKNPEAQLPRARRHYDPSTIRITGVILIVVSVLIPMLDPYLFVYPLLGSLGWTIGGLLIFRSKGLNWPVSILVAFICPVLSVAVLFMPDR